MAYRPPRIAVRAVILKENKILMVNAYPNGQSDLWCAPGGGVEPGSALPENLKREVFEETGLTISVGAPCLVNEFHAPDHGFHQIEIFFRAHIIAGEITPDWTDPEHIVSDRRFFSREELSHIRFKPDRLIDIAWGAENAQYDPLEVIVG